MCSIRQNDVMGTLNIRRASNYFGGARRLVIYVDGTKVAKLSLRKSMSLELPDGAHTVRARMDWVTCKPLVVNVTSEFVRTVEFSLPMSRLPLAFLVPWRGFAAREW